MAGLIKRGNQINLNSKEDIKNSYIRLKKDGDSVRVRILSLNDYIEYKAHSDFGNKIYTQPCIAPLGTPCPLCVAGKSGIDGFDGLYAKKRYLFAMANLDTGKVQVFDCSMGQLKGLLSQLDEYKDELEETAFTFKRTGSGTGTTYTLSPITGKKLTPQIQEAMSNFDGTVVEDNFFETVLDPREPKMMVRNLGEAGFPVEQYFPDLVENGTENVGAGNVSIEVKADEPDILF